MALPKLGERRYRIGLDRQSALAGCHRLGHSFDQHKDIGTTEQGLRQLRVNRMRFSKLASASSRRLRTSSDPPRLAPGNRMVGRERSIEVGEGLGRLPRVLERNAAIDERLGTGRNARTRSWLAIASAKRPSSCSSCCGHRRVADRWRSPCRSSRPLRQSAAGVCLGCNGRGRNPASERSRCRSRSTLHPAAATRWERKRWPDLDGPRPIGG